VFAQRFNPKALAKHLHSLVEKKVWLKVLIALFLGILTGALLKEFQNSFSTLIFNSLVNWIGLPGKLFLALIQMIVIPLVFVSVVRGISSGQSIEQLKKLGLRVGIYFIFTTVIAITIGFSISALIKPGQDASLAREATSSAPTAIETNTTAGLPLDTLPTKIVELLPQNPLVAMTEGQMLQIVLFAMIVGFALLSIPAQQSEPLMTLFASIQDVCMIVVKWAMYLAPLAVFGLIAETTARSGIETLAGMMGYVSTVILGLVGVLLFYLLLLRFVAKQNPFHFLSKIRQVQLLAFSTSSSAAVMPLTMETAEKDLNVDPNVSRFIIPLGTTINMDGTALYQGVATVFLANIFGIELNLSSMLLVVVTSIGASIGSPGTPGVGIVILAGILTNIGIPATGIALILGVDRILDMCRTVINVTGDLTAAVVMNYWMKLKPRPLNAR